MLSLDPLIEFWRREAESNSSGCALQARHFLEQVEQIPELHGAIQDRSVLTRHQELVQGMLSAVFPPGLKVLACGAASTPGTFDFFHTSERFARELLLPNGELAGRVVAEGLDFEYLRILFTYLLILRKCYGIDMMFGTSAQLELNDSQTGLRRYYQLRAQFDMVRMEPVGALPILPDDIKSILAPQVVDLELLRRLLPPERFRFYGFTVFEGTDVSDELLMSWLRQVLLGRDALLDPAKFQKVLYLLRSLLKLPEMDLALVGFEANEVIKILPDGGQKQIAFTDMGEILSSDCTDKLFSGHPVLKDDLTTGELCSPIMHRLLDEGFKSMMILPLTLDGEVRGVLGLHSRTPRALTALTELRLQGAIPLFAIAIKNALEKLNDRVEQVIKQKFTAIHPSVEWKFRRAAVSFVRAGCPKAKIDDVQFPVVYPLFGVSDIRSSSKIRNEAIQADLTHQLNLAKDVIHTAREHRPLPYLASQEFRIGRLIEELAPGLHSGDESRVSEFIKSEVEPMFDSLEGFAPVVRDKVHRYRDSVDPSVGVLYDQRKAYEQSVSELRDHIADILNEEQVEAQRIHPHYFELYKTDGVDHGIYAGPSIAENASFDFLYLKNLRLWQLMVMCRIARESCELEKKLPCPLATAHLILSQDVPIAIRYTQEERKFNVDGAYNARYEIMKKRIDKAEIVGSGERLTQPGTLAVVYTQRREAEEYLEYINFLRAQGMVSGPEEWHELAPLKDVQGLRAVRFSVNGA